MFFDNSNFWFHNGIPNHTVNWRFCSTEALALIHLKLCNVLFCGCWLTIFSEDWVVAKGNPMGEESEMTPNTLNMAVR